MDFIISLAHFCERHGPQTILSTQIHEEACGTCHPCSSPASDLSSSLDEPSYWTRGQLNPPTASLDTPPMSPKSPKRDHNPYFPRIPSEEDLTRNGAPDDKNDSCISCTYTVPEGYSKRLPNGTPGSPTKDQKSKLGGPVLRTSANVLVPGSSAASSDDESEPRSYSSRRGFTPTPPSSTTSPILGTRDIHAHHITCVTSHQLNSPAAYSLVRRSCLRALSGVNLPRASGSFIAGDPFAGNQVSYVFRVPDTDARGHRRLYALIAHGGRGGWDTTKAMKYIVREFEEIARRLIFSAKRIYDGGNGSRPSTAYLTPPGNFNAGAGAALISPNISTFIQGSNGRNDKPKSLAQVTGNDDIFVELHGQFCRILAHLVRSSNA